MVLVKMFGETYEIKKKSCAVLKLSIFISL